MIRIEKLRVSYGSETVLRDCSLHIPAGAKVALMGPSGCGKTTLLGVVAGLVRPESGQVATAGQVSYVFQDAALFPWLTALENINVVLSDTPATRDEARRLLQAAELADCADKYPRQLSGGQKQRIAICRALAYGGDILLLDEPLKGLDPETREKIIALILRESKDMAVLLVTHDRREAEALCDTVYTYSNGRFV